MTSEAPFAMYITHCENPKPQAETFLILQSLLVSHDCMPTPQTNTSRTVSLRGDGRGETAAGGRYGLCCKVEE